MYSGIYQIPKIDKVVFGKPADSVLPELVHELGASRVLILASKTLHTKTPVVSQLQEALEGKCVGIFDDIAPHTPRSSVIAATIVANDTAADLIVTVGGGSVTDAGKMIALCLANNIRTDAGLDKYRHHKGDSLSSFRIEIAAPMVRSISIPTTLSAGEFTSFAGCTDETTGHKEAFNHPYNVPQAIILDPNIAQYTPPMLWLSTGIRAIDHAVEGICSINSHPYAEGTALHAIRLLSSGLRRSKYSSQDMSARLDCFLGMWLAIVGPQSGVHMGASHAIGHVLGGAAGVAHGYTSCVMLPSVMRYNETVTANKQQLIAAAMGKAGNASEAVAELIAELELPRTLNDVGVSASQFRKIAENTMHDPCIHTNPRTISGPQDVMEILSMAA